MTTAEERSQVTSPLLCIKRALHQVVRAVDLFEQEDVVPAAMALLFKWLRIIRK